MGIDYTKRPAAQPAQPPQSGQAAPVSLSKVTLTKSAPTVSLTKQGSSTGILRVNLNWNAKPGGGGGGLFKRSAPTLDLDLGCLYEFTDGSKGVVQALGNAFQASPRGVAEPVIRLDGDDRSGTNAEGENLLINLGYANQIKRVLVFALIYQGAANWAAADGVVTLYPATGPQVEVRLDETRDGARICGIALLESNNGELSVRREVNYIDGSQSALDRAYGWGMNWAPGRK
ncbi:MAG: tellurite resistance protein TerA [Pseudonocardiales bacterium]|jgi:tellurite resistance protein TerA|nr:tellurite resistance protein TerA [Pseudonocardiales bacterium]